MLLRVSPVLRRLRAPLNMNSSDFIGVEHDRPDRQKLHHAGVYCANEIRHGSERRIGGATVVSANWSLEGLEPLVFYQVIIKNFDGHVPGLRSASQGLINAPSLLCFTHIVDGSIRFWERQGSWSEDLEGERSFRNAVGDDISTRIHHEAPLQVGEVVEERGRMNSSMSLQAEVI